MKTRRIYLQPGECVEVINNYGTSMLKAIARFQGDTPCVVIYEQPDVDCINASEIKGLNLTLEPDGEIDLSLFNSSSDS